MKYGKQINSIFNTIDDGYLIDLICDFSSIKSVWDPENGFNELKAAQWFENQAEIFGLKHDLYLVNEMRPNVIIELPGSLNNKNSKTLLLEGHTDVVTEGDTSLWSSDPFSPTIIDDRIIGRGVNDMKSGLMCALYAMYLIKESNLKLNGNLLCAALCDEEGEMIGVKNFIKTKYAKNLTSVIVCEPEENRICIEQKGVAWVKIKVKGEMSHGAMPYAGQNSSYPMANILIELEKLNDKYKEFNSKYLGTPSVTPTIIQSPSIQNGVPQNNVMPGDSEMVLDVRLIPELNVSDFKKSLDLIIKDVIDKFSIEINYEFIDSRPPVKVDKNTDIVQIMKNAYEYVSGKPAIFAGVPGSTDGTIISDKLKIPVVVCGPGSVTAPHQIDEYIDIFEIKESIRIYITSIINYLGISDDN
jgi:succinyl-diaminopimelate desuccinylase